MSLTNRYLDFQANNIILTRLGIDTQAQSNITKYNECFSNYMDNTHKINNYIRDQINNYIEKNYSLINVIDTDINYYIEKINLFVGKKFKNVIDELNITHIISLCDYFKKTLTLIPTSDTFTNHYVYWRNEYYKLLYSHILCGEYKVFGRSDKNTLMILIEEEWNKIDFTNLIEFTNSLNKINFLGQNVDEYITMITNKFDNIENIKKLLEYINKKLQYTSTFQQNNNLSDTETSNELDDLDINELTSNTNTSKYNFRFVVDNLKSNSYLLFEELNKNIKIKYKKPQTIQIIKTDKRIINYFLYLISHKDSNTTNRKVNEILIKMKNYLVDIEESYYNIFAYRKISVKQESEKYKFIDLSSYNRENTSFTIFKYSNLNQTNINVFNLTSKIEPYFDIYKSYYKSRYPDREIEFDPIQSTMIVKMIFLTKPYYVHLALIQYIVLDKLFNQIDGNGLGIKDISTQTNIPIKNLQETINSLLHIKLIKRSINATSVLDMKLFINYDFVHENNKISICSLVVKKEEKEEHEENDDKKEFLNDRNTIILSNMYDYIKKNRSFTLDLIYNDMCKNKIPFKIDLEQVMAGIKIMLEKEDIMEIIQNEIKSYKFCE